MELFYLESQSANHVSLSKSVETSWFSFIMISVAGTIIFSYWYLPRRAISKAILEGVHVISHPK